MKRFVACLVLIALFSITFQPFTHSLRVAAANKESPSYKRGKEDGRRAGNKDTEILWSVIDFIYGFALGPIAVGHSLVSRYVLEPKLPKERRNHIYNRNQDYRKGFKAGYIQVKESYSLILRSTGWLGWIGTWAVLDQMRQ